MAQECPDLQVESVKNGLVLSSLDTANGTRVNITCAHSDRRLVGATTLQCLSNGDWSERLPTCQDNALTERETIIISVASVLVGVLLILLIVVVVCVYFAKERRRLRMSERLQSRLDKLTLHDPLDELVRRESSRRGVHNAGFTTTSYPSSELPSGRHLYIIWNHSRNMRQLVFAESLPELCEKAAQRLGVKEPLSVVLEENGTQVTSDEMLSACHGDALLILQFGENWTPAAGLEHVTHNGDAQLDGQDSGVGDSGDGADSARL